MRERESGFWSQPRCAVPRGAPQLSHRDLCPEPGSPGRAAAAVCLQLPALPPAAKPLLPPPEKTKRLSRAALQITPTFLPVRPRQGQQMSSQTPQRSSEQPVGAQPCTSPRRKFPLSTDPNPVVKAEHFAGTG